MKRRNFLHTLSTGSALLLTSGELHNTLKASPLSACSINEEEVLLADVVIVGGGLGGVASALSLLRNGRTVILTEETDWLGGQLTQQGVPLDEHRWIEHTGCTKSYRNFRNKIREYYKCNYPLKEEVAKVPYFNPGNASVSSFCHEPKVALTVIRELLAPYLSSGRLRVFYNYKPVECRVNIDRIEMVVVKNTLKNEKKALKASYFVDATELGDLLPLSRTEFVSGTESRTDTNELHAPIKGNAENVQAFTTCFAVDYLPGENHIIEKPSEYGFWKAFVPPLKEAWPGKLLDLSYSNPRTLQKTTACFAPDDKGCGEVFNLWSYRRIIDRNNFEKGFYSSDISLINWPQNDYMLGNLIGTSDRDFSKLVEGSKQLSLSLLYWLQTEVPRPDGGKGWAGLRLRKDVLGSSDGLAKYPYVRESRRIKSMFTILEEHVGVENRRHVVANAEDSLRAADFYDSVGIGYYPIDLHPTCGGDNYIDFASLRFQIPLGALLPIRMKNLLPANKNIGTTHITNGCYRVHPVEWSIGEAVGLLAFFSLENDCLLPQVRTDRILLSRFQSFLRSEGVETEWPWDEE